jgi:hypothetical protein
MQDVRIEIDAVRPGDRSGNRIDVQTRENLGIAQRCQYAVCKQWFEIEFSDEPVGEREPDGEPIEALGVVDAR